MLGRTFEACGRFGDRVAAIAHDETVTWTQWNVRRRQLEQEWPSLAGRRVGLAMRPSADSIAALAALERLACDVFLLDGQQPREDCLRRARLLNLAAVLCVEGPAAQRAWQLAQLPGELPGTGAGSVTILTSGTTGEPKAVRHSWEGLARPVRPTDPQSPQRWLLTYRPHLYAGLQVVLQCLTNYGTLVLPAVEAAPDEVARLMCTAGVQYASATPSYWRRLILFADHERLRRVPLEQITLGGEVVDQQILDALGQLFPAARRIHIYATTELGRCFSVTDGRAGFPAALLDQPLPEGVALRVVDGQLLVRSANAMLDYDARSPQASRPEQGWFPTGDLVVVEGDRVRFVGRASDLINVGGDKVAPLVVEQTVREVPGVRDVRVFAQASSLAGQLVACQLVAAPDWPAEEVRQAVAAHCRDKLPPTHRPRVIHLVPQVSLTDSHKTSRQAEG